MTENSFIVDCIYNPIWQKSMLGSFIKRNSKPRHTVFYEELNIISFLLAITHFFRK